MSEVIPSVLGKKQPTVYLSGGWMAARGMHAATAAAGDGAGAAAVVPLATAAAGVVLVLWLVASRLCLASDCSQSAQPICLHRSQLCQGGDDWAANRHCGSLQGAPCCPVAALLAVVPALCRSPACLLIVRQPGFLRLCACAAQPMPMAVQPSPTQPKPTKLTRLRFCLWSAGQGAGSQCAAPVCLSGHAGQHYNRWVGFDAQGPTALESPCHAAPACRQYLH